jgi:hypothetical protein
MQQIVSYRSLMQSAAYFMKNDISSIICQLCTGIAPPPEPPTKAVHSGQIKQIIGGDNSRGICALTLVRSRAEEAPRLVR